MKFSMKLDLSAVPKEKVEDVRVFDWDADVISATNGAALVGSADAIRSGELRKRGIVSVVSCINRVEEYKLRENLEGYADSGALLIINLSDEEKENPIAEFSRVSHWIAECSKPVLIHCWQGISRSTTFCCQWMMHTQGFGVEGAISAVRRDRSIACPNAGFVRVLHAWNWTLREASCVVRTSPGFALPYAESHWLVPERVVVGRWPSVEPLSDRVTLVVNLTEPREVPSRKLEPRLLPAGALELKFPIVDGLCAESDAQLTQFAMGVAERLVRDDSALLYVHCVAGRGRSGIFAGVLLSCLLKLHPALPVPSDMELLAYVQTTYNCRKLAFQDKSPEFFPQMEQIMRCHNELHSLKSSLNK